MVRVLVVVSFVLTSTVWVVVSVAVVVVSVLSAPRMTEAQPAAGHTNAQIARRLDMSEGRVRTHLENIYERLKVSSRTAAVTHAFAGRTV